MKISLGGRVTLSISLVVLFSASYSAAFAETDYFAKYVATLDRTCQNGDLTSCKEGASLGFNDLIERDGLLGFLNKACSLGNADSCDYYNQATSGAGDITLRKIDPENFKVNVSDRDAQPLVRIPPQIPLRFVSGDHSGYCEAKFDVSPQGKPINVVATYCTNSQLKKSTVQSIQKWKYNPKIVNGRPVSRSGVQTRVKFHVIDERGRALPYPDE